MKKINGISYTEDGKVLVECESSVKGEVIIEPGVEGIMPSAFKGCADITSIVLCDTIVQIGTSAFEGTSITQLILPDSVKYVGPNACSECCFLQSVQCSHCLETLGKMAFYGCVSLERIDLENTCVNEIHKETFAHCHSLKNISLNENIKIHGLAFLNCKQLEAQILISEVSSCSKNAFIGCKNVTVYKKAKIRLNEDSFEVRYIPGQKIKAHQFENAAGLYDFTVPSHITTIEEAAFKATGLKNLRISGNIEKIPTECFAECKLLQSVIIEEGVKYLEHDCFRGCTSLEHIDLPSSINHVEPDSFKDCKRLCDVYIGPETTYDDTSFVGCSEKLKVTKRDQVDIPIIKEDAIESIA